MTSNDESHGHTRGLRGEDLPTPTPTPGTPLSRALSHEVRELEAQLLGDELIDDPELNSQVQQSELGALSNMFKVNADATMFPCFDFFESFSNDLDSEHYETLCTVKADRRRLKKVNLRSSSSSGTTIVSDIDKAAVKSGVRDILYDRSMELDLRLLSPEFVPPSSPELPPDEVEKSELTHGAASASTDRKYNLDMYDREVMKHLESISTNPNVEVEKSVGHGESQRVPGWQCLTAPPSRIVKTVEQGLEFQKDALQFLLTDEHCDTDPETVINHLTDAMENDSLSTCYSGVESAHTATNCNAYALAELTGNPPIRVPLSHMIEWDPENQKELLMVAESHPECCLFGDVAGFFREEIANTIKELKDIFSQQ